MYAGYIFIEKTKYLYCECIGYVAEVVCLLEVVFTTGPDTKSLSHGVTNATVWAAPCFPFHTRQVFKPFLTFILFLSISLFFLSFLYSLCHHVNHFANNGVVVNPGLPCVTGVWGECLVSPIIVPVTAVSSALAVLHIQVGKVISTHLYLFVIGCLYPHCSAILTDAQEGNDKRI